MVLMWWIDPNARTPTSGPTLSDFIRCFREWRLGPLHFGST